MSRGLPLSLLALLLLGCAQPVPPSGARIVPGTRVVVDSPPRPSILPVILAAPSAPVFPTTPQDAAVSRANTQEPEVIELGVGRWELPPPVRMRPLSQLSPEASRFIAERGGSVSVGVFVPADNAVYVASPELAVPMASVAKLVILLALIDRAESAGRTLTADEVALVEPMMVWSDNESATLLWDALGGGHGVSLYLERLGVRGIVLDPLAWGDSHASGPAVAWLLAQLAFGDLVNPEHRELALGLLGRAAAEQPWGVSAGVMRKGADAFVGAKDGWYPVASGWRAGSAGLVLPAAGQAATTVPYSIAVLTAENADLEDGIATIEGLVDRVQAALTPRGAG